MHFKDTQSLNWASEQVELLKSNCIYQVQQNQPLPADVYQIATAPLPEEWFSITEDTSITEILAIQPQPISTTPGLTTEQPTIYTPALLERLKYIGCPNDCSGNGECKRGSTYIP